MSTELPAVPLPPSPLQARVESQADWQLSWWTVLYLALAGFAGSILGLLLPSLLHTSARVQSLSFDSLAGVGYHAARGLLFGLGVVLMDRCGPGTWPRSARWAVGAALGTCLSSLVRLPFLVHSFAGAGGRAALVSMVGPMLVFGVVGAAAGAFFAFYLGWRLRPETRPWHRLPLAALEASLIVNGVYFAITIVGLIVTRAFLQSTALQLAQSFGILLAVSVISSPLTGCAFAAGLKRAAAPPER